MKLHFFLLLVLIIIFFHLNEDILIELYGNSYQTFQSFIPLNSYKYPTYPLVNSFNWFNNFFPISNGYTNLPWWNTSLGNTTNMSYDLRGDPLRIPRTNFVWDNGTNFPIYNQTI